MKVANRQRVACSPGLLCRCCGRRTGHTTSPGRRGEARPTPLSPRRKFIVRRLERCALNDRRKFGPPPNVFMRASGDGRDGDGGLSWKGGRQETFARPDGRTVVWRTAFNASASVVHACLCDGGALVATEFGADSLSWKCYVGLHKPPRSPADRSPPPFPSLVVLLADRAPNTTMTAVAFVCHCHWSLRPVSAFVVTNF